MKWLRLYNDTITDPKWRVVAADSGQPLTAVLSVWMSMLINASDSDDRGTLQGWDDRFAGAAIDLRGDDVRDIREAMQGIVLDGDRLTGWDKRQRSSDDINERVKRHRTKAKETPPGGGSTNGAGKDGNVTKPKCNVTPTLQQQDVTEKPLTLTLLPTPTLNKNDDDDAGAHEIAVLVTGLSGVVDKRGAATVQSWLAKGYHPQLDIYPVVQEVTTRAPGAIGSFKYFTGEIDRHHAARISPPSNVSYLPRAAGGRQAPSNAMSPAARDLMAALDDPNFDYGMRR